MSSLTTDRAGRRAYFSDISGGHIIEFQFSPSELDFSEGGNFSRRQPTGSYFQELVWISGKTDPYDIRLFIDRTQESYTVDEYNKDPFASFKRFPNRNPRYNNAEVFSYITGIGIANTSSGFASSFRKKQDGGANEVQPSIYNATPHFKQTQFEENVGVIRDLESLLYYVRPKGLKISEATIQSDGTVDILDFPQSRFTPPPMVRFYYGEFWREGYITQVKYTLSAMNKLLVPRRMDATITMECTKWGYLNEPKGSVLGADTA